MLQEIVRDCSILKGMVRKYGYATADTDWKHVT